MPALFDAVGRRIMMYLTCGILLIVSAQLFKAGVLNATTQVLCWTVLGTAWFVERLAQALASCHPGEIRCRL